MGHAFEEWSCKNRGENTFQFGDNDLRRWYQRDIDQITHSTPFRKLQRKSQLLSEKDPRSRSRLIHTIEVSRISTEISEELGLSKELAEAICMGHDIGTSPYGYVGNTFLSRRASGFSHEQAGAYMLESLSKKEANPERRQILAAIENGFNATLSEFDNFCVAIDGFPFKLRASRNLSTAKHPKVNLYYISPEIIDGVYHHGSNGVPATLEGDVVRYSDNIAYLSQDIDDLICTAILDVDDFAQISQRTKLEFLDEEGSAHTSTWGEIDAHVPEVSLKDVFSASRGKRISTFIKRYVNYNLKRLENNELAEKHSPILEKKVPILAFDDGLKYIIDFMWAYISTYYSDCLIHTSNNIQTTKMEQLWDIISDPRLLSSNKCYKKFTSMVNDDSRFDHFTSDWKKAYFISYLSWQEVDLIIDSYHQRDFSFELDILELEDFPYENS